MRHPVRSTAGVCIALATVAVAVLTTATAASASRPAEPGLLPQSAAQLPVGSGKLPTSAAPNLPAVDSVKQTVSSQAAGSTGQDLAILKYWTPQRMRAASPMRRKLPKAGPAGLGLGGLLPINPGAEPVPSQDGRQDSTDGQQTPDGPSANVPAQDTAAQTPAAAGDGGGFSWRSGGLIVRTTGKVFFTLSGHDYVCSATSVAGRNRDTVVTAGHCVNDGPGEFASRWMFAPGYHNGQRPYGGWTARRLFTSAAWSQKGDINSDIGFAVVNTRNGRHLADAVGTQAIAFDQPRGRYAYAFGYPAVGNYDGETLYYCRDTPKQDQYGSTDQGIKCDLTEGASGGGWLTGFNPRTGVGTVTSVSSFGYDDNPNVMYGPYFGGAAHTLYNRVQAA